MKSHTLLALITLLTAIASTAYGGSLSLNDLTMHEHHQTTLNAPTDSPPVWTQDSGLTINVDPVWQVTRSSDLALEICYL